MGADLNIPENVLLSARISADELLIELAVYLYDQERLSIGQAKNLAQTDLISFQKELAKRNVYIKFDVSDFEDDMKTLSRLSDSTKDQ